MLPNLELSFDKLITLKQSALIPAQPTGPAKIHEPKFIGVRVAIVALEKQRYSAGATAAGGVVDRFAFAPWTAEF